MGDARKAPGIHTCVKWAKDLIGRSVKPPKGSYTLHGNRLELALESKTLSARERKIIEAILERD